MTIVIQPKDTGQKVRLEDVKCYFFDYGALHIYFEDGVVRRYPDRHIWYVTEPLQ